MCRLWVLAAALSVVGVAGCQKVNSNTAIREAIENHLHQNGHLMLNNFTTHFEKIAQNGDTAQVLVKYQSKKLPNAAVQVSYGLKKISGQWQVVSSSSVGGQMTNPGNPHETLDQDTSPGAAGPGAPGPIASH